VKNLWVWAIVVPLVVAAVWYLWATLGPESRSAREQRERVDAENRAYWREQYRLEEEAAAKEREAAAKRFEREVDEGE
jgi:hypothetical protein